MQELMKIKRERENIRLMLTIKQKECHAAWLLNLQLQVKK